VKAIGDFVAALLGLVGFIGKPRRRAAIGDDLKLLLELEGFEEFRRGTPPHEWLSNHIAIQIAEFSGLDLRTSRRNVAWSSVILATAIWMPLGWLTYHLVAISHPWYATFSAAPAALFALVTVTMLFEKEEVVPDEAEDEAEVS
jgi:hypothetical protein